MKHGKWLALALTAFLAVSSLAACSGPQGIQGEVGPQGEIGPQGPQGIQGEKGDTGAQGPQGIQGEVGPQGEIGPQGPQGIQGEVGPQGEIGPQGPQGIQGEKGDTGAQGEKGDKGDTGAQGEKGDKGDTGAQGEKGDKGDTGEQGEKGEKGDKGDKGDTGAQGEKGDTGAQGNIGLSAYQIYLKFHPEYTGTEEEWLADYTNGTLSRHTVTFDLGGGTAPEGFEASVEARYGMPIPLSVPTREGYTFMGWYTGETPADGIFTTTDIVTSDLSLIALWRINRHTVRFLDYYGDTVKIEEVDYGTASVPPALPSSFGSHFFQGWSADTSNVTEDMVVDAIYIQKTYTVTYHINGTEKNELAYYGDVPVKPADPVVDGLIFNGWFADEYYTVPYTFDTAANTDIHVYAMLSEYKMISTAEELKNIAYGYYDSKYMLANDINLNGEQWTPLGYFYGVLDGNGHKIHNFTMSGTGSELGFINYNYGTIENLTLSDFAFSISTSSVQFNAGVLAGTNSGTIRNCKVLDGIASFIYYHGADSGTFASCIGGLVGQNTGKLLGSEAEIAISSSVSAGNTESYYATGYSTYVYIWGGALVGNNTGTIDQCRAQSTYKYSTGPTSVSYGYHHAEAIHAIGGAIGENSGEVTNTECLIDMQSSVGVSGTTICLMGGFVSRNLGNISNCFVTGALTDTFGYHTAMRTGGFVGDNNGIINNSYANVNQNTKSADNSISRAGGFVAVNTKTITNCYATGSIDTAVTAGAASFAGLNSAAGVISKCFSSCSVNVTSSGAVTGYFVAVAEGGSSIFKCYYDADKKVMSGSYTLTPTNTEGTAAALTDFHGTALVVDTMSWPTDVWYISEDALPILLWQKVD